MNTYGLPFLISSLPLQASFAADPKRAHTALHFFEWLAVAVLASVPLTWFLAGRGGATARGAAWTLLVVRVLLAEFVFPLLQPFSNDWYLEC